MARYSGPVCRLCRREGMKLFLKGDRCFTEKCAIEKRNYAPGQHGKGGRIKSKLQGYGLQLREKQKVKRLYRMQEGQFAPHLRPRGAGEGRRGRGAARQAGAAAGQRGLPPRLRRSRDQARQLVRHGHVRVNDKKLDIPSYQVNEGEVITLSSRAGKNAQVQQSVESVKGRGVPKWLELDAAAFKGRVLSMPAREDVNFPIQEQLIVELYSK